MDGEYVLGALVDLGLLGSVRGVYWWYCVGFEVVFCWALFLLCVGR